MQKCMSVQTRQSLHCLHTQSMDVGEDYNQILRLLFQLDACSFYIFNVVSLLLNVTVCLYVCIIWALARENLSFLHGNNKGTDQPVHLSSLVSAFVIHYLECIIAKPDTYKVSVI